jgi:hypothetical protein
MMATVRTTNVDRFNHVYNQYVRPLEQSHPGQYVMVAPDGRMIVAPDLSGILERVDQLPETGNFLYKVGKIAAAEIL